LARALLPAIIALLLAQPLLSAILAAFLAFLALLLLLATTAAAILLLIASPAAALFLFLLLLRLGLCQACQPVKDLRATDAANTETEQRTDRQDRMFSCRSGHVFASLRAESATLHSPKGADFTSILGPTIARAIRLADERTRSHGKGNGCLTDLFRKNELAR
jgi:hypothetical protein